MDFLTCLSVALFQNTFKDQYLSESLEVQLPVVESHSEDVIVSLTHAVAPFGMVGVNLYLADHIMRRYIATVNGVLQVYPGCLLSTNYDPTRRPWFRKALQQPGKIITTELYLDAGGVGYIVTIAHTIFENKSIALHSVERAQPVAIGALDLPYAYYYKMILDSTPLCQMKHIKCLLFENEGYLLAHPSMLEPSTTLQNQRHPHQHLTHKDSYLANNSKCNDIGECTRISANTKYYNICMQDTFYKQHLRRHIFALFKSLVV